MFKANVNKVKNTHKYINHSQRIVSYYSKCEINNKLLSKCIKKNIEEMKKLSAILTSTEKYMILNLCNGFNIAFVT